MKDKKIQDKQLLFMFIVYKQHIPCELWVGMVDYEKKDSCSESWRRLHLSWWGWWPHCHPIINNPPSTAPQIQHVDISFSKSFLNPPPLSPSPLAPSLNPQDLSLLLIGPSLPDQGQIHSLQISDGFLTFAIRHKSWKLLHIRPPGSDYNHNFTPHNQSTML